MDINNYPAHSNAGGWQREYFPDGFFDGDYSNRSDLYKKVRRQIDRDVYDNSLNEGFSYNSSNVSFEAESPNEMVLIENQVVKAPHFSANIRLKDDAGIDGKRIVVQILFIYYTGYNHNYGFNHQ